MNQEHVSALKFCIIPPNPFKYSTKKMLHSVDMCILKHLLNTTVPIILLWNYVSSFDPYLQRE